MLLLIYIYLQVCINLFLISFYNKLIFSILTAPPPPPPPCPIMTFLYNVCNVTTIMQKDYFRHGGKARFLFSICWIEETEFSTHISNSIIVLLRMIRGLKLLSFLWKKNSIFLETFLLSFFIGNSSLRPPRSFNIPRDYMSGKKYPPPPTPSTHEVPPRRRNENPIWYILYLLFVSNSHIRELRALRGYFGPPMRQKNEIRFSPNSTY